MAKHIRIERRGANGAVATLIIDRRERFNSLDGETAQDFRKAGLQLSRDGAIRCVVVRGAGGVSCSGADLKYVRERGDAGDFEYPPGRGGSRDRLRRELQADPKLRALARIAEGAEFAEGLTAFSGKRPPVFPRPA